ncbi:hypothetical protein [Nocardia brasiliensis]|uniref:Uncharacterized protein n=1 Tax=Nocardia brasiliensis (strain ATCC 700358 / HUJEG-1) TaxID=1133849 RepID=K0EY71_NOCB7|nr:hypothetical protein [Nocardia brasiliensis]AFU04798.1 hypothetical protein O3I_034245 [Nocardia brasiliensis ATCC 700358]OCF88239.1 hypothetical protein AW168_21290 [Nocardia brasiliensis]
MERPSVIRRLATVFATTAVAAGVFAGSAGAAPSTVDWGTAAQQLRAAAAGNAQAEQAVDRLLASGQLNKAGQVALPAQPFQIPAQSDIGRGDGPGVYGSGIALGLDGFRFGFFGGPGTIAPNQGGAKLEVLWINLSNGRSGTEVLNEHNDVPVDTTIRSRALDTGAGMIVAAVYGSLWHRWSVPVSDANPDGYQYQLGTISVPSFGAVYN